MIDNKNKNRFVLIGNFRRHSWNSLLNYQINLLPGPNAITANNKTLSYSLKSSQYKQKDRQKIRQ